MIDLIIFLVLLELCWGKCPERYSGFSSSCHTCSHDRKNLADKLCVEMCPTGSFEYTSCSKTKCCSSPQGSIFTIDLSNSENPFQTFARNIDLLDNSQSPSLLISQNNKMFYFTYNKTIENSENFIPSFSFSFNLQIKPLEDGNIVRVESSIGNHITIEARENKYKFMLAVSDSLNEDIWEEIFIEGEPYQSIWHTLSFKFKQASCNAIDLMIETNGKISSRTFLGVEANFPNDFFRWIIGNAVDVPSFRGFVYWLEARNNLEANFPQFFSINAGSENLYRDELSCINCKSSHLSSPQRNQIIHSRNLPSCFTGCSACSSSLFNDCTSCNAGLVEYSYFCLNDCPTGKSLSSNECIGPNLGFSFDLTSSLILSTVGAWDIGIDNTNIYPIYDAHDPKPAINRGYYFNFVDRMSTTGAIGPSFALSIWLRIISSGLILVKSLSSDYLVIQEGSGTILVAILMTDGGTISFSTTNICNAWCDLELSAEPGSSGSTLIKAFINGSQFSIQNAMLAAFFDNILANLYVGSDLNFMSGFEGFISRLQIYQDSSYVGSDIIHYACTGGCSECPSNSLCLSGCEFDNFPDSCYTCGVSCISGCKSGSTCNLCKNKECYECSSYSNTCISCVANADFSGTDCKCKSEYGWHNSNQACEACEVTNCELCTEDVIACTKCKSPYYYIMDICLTFCPTGYTASDGVCVQDPVLNGFVFDLKPHKIEDVVYDLQSDIPVVAGLTHDFYPAYHSTDPYAAIERGYYFTGSSVMMAPPNWSNMSPLLIISPEFTILVWHYPINNGWIFSKQDLSGNIRIAVGVDSQQPAMAITLQDGSLCSLIGPSTLTMSQWTFTMFYATTEWKNENIWIYSNGVEDDWSGLSVAYFVDLDSSFTILFGARYDNSGNFADYFQGFLWEFKIYNQKTTGVFYISSAYASGVSCFSPIELSGNCIPNCSIDETPDNGSCSHCDASCFFGCRKVGSCNLCFDPLCYKCNDYGLNCLLCKNNAALSISSCVCNFGYSYDPISEECVQLTTISCDVSCNTCTDIYYNNCVTCANNYYSYAGLCLRFCPRGYYVDLNGICQLANSIIFELDLNTLKGVVYDKKYMVPAVTGSTQNFYKNYDLDDPLPAYLRGFYFNGISSMLNLPDFGSYTSPVLLIGPIFTFSAWINPESSSSALFSKKNNSLSSYLIISLSNGYPKILINLAHGALFSFTCQKAASLFQWNHIAIVSDYSTLGTTITCIVNTIQDVNGNSPGYFNDISTNMRVTIGSDSSSLTSGASYYKGFIYHVNIYCIANYNADLSLASCFEDCLSCPLSHECIPNCPIYEYWLGPSYKACSDCTSSCLTCKDQSLSCNLCWNKICNICDDYTQDSCLNCIENAKNPENCICNENYYWNSTYEKCYKNDGYYTGSDGNAYPCPDLCLTCLSNVLCSTCVENAIIVDGICICNDGYRNDNQLCVKMLFSAYLSINQDNSLILSFSEELFASISNSDINIYIGTQKLAFTMEASSLTTFYISMKIQNRISKGTEIILHFIDNINTRSKQRAYLITTNLYGNLFDYDPESLSDDTDSIVLQTKATIQSAVSASLIFSLLASSPSSFWSFINFLTLLSYLPLSGIDFSQKIRYFFQNLISFNLIPNIFEWFIDEETGGTPYKNAYKAGFKTDLLFLNAGGDFTVILFLIIAVPLIYYFSNCSYTYIAKYIKKILKSYKFSVFLRFWIQIYLELGISSLICLTTHSSWNLIQYFNKSLSAILMLFLFITPILFGIFCWRNKEYIVDRDKQFFSIWNTFFYEFKNSEGFMSTQFYTIFFLRRLVYIVTLIILQDFPSAEVTINIVHSLLSTIYLIRYWPCNDTVVQVGNLITEIGITIVMGFTGAFLCDMDENTLIGIENAIIWTTNAIIGVNLICSMIVLIRNIWNIFKDNFIEKKSTERANKYISSIESATAIINSTKLQKAEKVSKLAGRLGKGKNNKIKTVII